MVLLPSHYQACTVAQPQAPSFPVSQDRDVSEIYFCSRGLLQIQVSPQLGYNTSPLCHYQSSFEDLAFISNVLTTSGILFLSFFRYLLLCSTCNSRCPPNSCRTACFASTLSQGTHTWLTRCPSVVNLAFQSSLDWFEPHSYLQLISFVLLCSFCQYTSFACFISVLMMSSGHVFSCSRLASLGRLLQILSFHRRLHLLALRFCPRCRFPHLSSPSFSHIVFPLTCPNCLRPETSRCTSQFMPNFKIVNFQEQRERH